MKAAPAADGGLPRIELRYDGVSFSVKRTLRHVRVVTVHAHRGSGL